MSTTISQNPPLLLSEAEAGELLNVCAKTVYRMRKEGKISFLRLRGVVRYSRDDLLAFIAAESKTVSADDSTTTDNAPRS
ncbi:helix-turn-helix domain-containing protein [Gimesia sp.]|uniref:helix-turn-helix domain-containing protein n=1 Tax=Gimesia sp. TaxID=2024833 RepID=UPI003A8F1296